MKILILGGSGYIGSVLCNLLLNFGHKIKVIDTQWFGKNLYINKNLKIVKKDIRELNKKDFKDQDVIIHLANIANDPSVLLKPELSWNVNVLSSMRICELAILNKIKKIIFLSSGSVYGISKEKKVTEETVLKPISIYNKTKMIAERVFQSYSKYLNTTIIRPATVCGVSKRLRLDVSVNMLTYQAWKNNLITVLGGSQIRPNIHILDLCNVIIHFLNKKNSYYQNEIFNAGFENLSILEISKKIQKLTNCKIKIKNSNDPRSYRLNSDKLLQTGYLKKYSVEDAILQLLLFFKKNKFRETNKNFNIKRTKDLDIK
tara:strand:+ start:6490 stop:7437 length:948 start_codon:yes stop_codon:yes gene_type:complete